MGSRERLLEALDWQRRGMERPSPLYARLLDAVITDVETGGPCARLLGDPPPDPVADAFVLRFLGGVHRIVLDGRAPALAAFYPSAGGRYDAGADDPVPAFLDTVAAHVEELTAALGHPVQTNEVARCAALLPGFLAVAVASGLPLRVLEVGASAGLNLRWDHYRYEGGADGSVFGDPASPLRFDDVYRDPRPRLAGMATVAERRGCDRAPIDAQSHDGRMTLRSFVWPDQGLRYAHLDAALEVARDVPVVIDRADAAEWVATQLSRPADGAATVVFHSIVWQYFSAETKRGMKDAIVTAGVDATADAPIAWLRFEPAPDPTKGVDVSVRLWPGGRERVLIRSGYHGKPVRVAAP